MQFGEFVQQLGDVGVAGVDHAHSLRGGHTGDLTELVGVGDEPNVRVPLEEFGQRHRPLGRFEREPLDEQPETLVVFHRQGRDGELMQRQQVPKFLGTILRQVHQIVAQAVAERLAGLLQPLIFIERLARGRGAEVIGIDDGFGEKCPVGKQIAGRFRKQHAFQVHPIAALCRGSERVRHHEGDPLDIAGSSLQRNRVEEPRPEHLFAKSQQLAFAGPVVRKFLMPRQGCRIDELRTASARQANGNGKQPAVMPGELQQSVRLEELLAARLALEEDLRAGARSASSVFN